MDKYTHFTRGMKAAPHSKGIFATGLFLTFCLLGLACSSSILGPSGVKGTCDPWKEPVLKSHLKGDTIIGCLLSSQGQETKGRLVQLQKSGEFHSWNKQSFSPDLEPSFELPGADTSKPIRFQFIALESARSTPATAEQAETWKGVCDLLQPTQTVQCPDCWFAIDFDDHKDISKKGFRPSSCKIYHKIKAQPQESPIKESAQGNEPTIDTQQPEPTHSSDASTPEPEPSQPEPSKPESTPESAPPKEALPPEPSQPESSTGGPVVTRPVTPPTCSNACSQPTDKSSSITTLTRICRAVSHFAYHPTHKVLIAKQYSKPLELYLIQNNGNLNTYPKLFYGNKSGGLKGLSTFGFAENHKYFVATDRRVVTIWPSTQLFTSTKPSDVKPLHIHSHPNLSKVPGHSTPGGALALHPTKAILAFADFWRPTTQSKPFIRIYSWDAQQIKLLKTLQVKASIAPPDKMAFSKDGKVLAVGLTDGNIELFDWENRRTPDTLTKRFHQIGAMTFSPDNRYLVAGGFNTARQNNIAVWDVTKPTRPATVLRQNASQGTHPEVIRSLSFRKDGQVLLSVDGKSLVKIWNFKSRQFIKEQNYGVRLSSREIGSIFLSDCNTIFVGTGRSQNSHTLKMMTCP